MSITTLYQIANYYDKYREDDITLTSPNIKAIGLVPKYILLKIKDKLCHCIIHSTSMTKAVVLVSQDSLLIPQLKEINTAVSLKYCFIDSDGNHIVFFVNANVETFDTYENNPSVKIVSLKFTQRPPDDLILRLGVFDSVVKNFSEFSNKGIQLDLTSLRELNLEGNSLFASILGMPRKSIVKSISFSGATVITAGLPKLLVEKAITLNFVFTDSYENIKINGVIKDASFIEGRQDICKIDVKYNEEEIPFTYKFHINRYLVSNRLI